MAFHVSPAAAVAVEDDMRKITESCEDLSTVKPEMSKVSERRRNILLKISCSIHHGMSEATMTHDNSFALQ